MPLPKVIVIAGSTGSGKSAIIRFINDHFYPAIDLETLANHRGSAFGQLHFYASQKDSQPSQEALSSDHSPTSSTSPNNTQPSQQQFEAAVQQCWDKHLQAPLIFLEQEAPFIGKCKIPDWLCQQIATAFTIRIYIPKTIRIQHILDTYGNIPVPLLSAALQQLEKRVSPQQMMLLNELLQAGEAEAFVENLLSYYDHSLHYLPGYAHELYFDHGDIPEIATAIVEYVRRAFL
ncbi:hypothetical protein CLV59_104108 [Chitinophaga dinghuensis]|uniref:tRNA 2-selenouridine synthase AAA domain-containing protein n=1 Tax=Chitinophaga dinghuensis TaxID=1539050 RepID=A0A327VZT2_9BACT|nr:hypothetical protein [Chitinophaga dinghuensis]RAJ81883.1 hypothetical protein CLV59_104108 [Chitinophaga dinghuensis]